MSKIPSSSDTAYWILLWEICLLYWFTHLWNTLLFSHPYKLILFFVTWDRKWLIKGKPCYRRVVSEWREQVVLGDSPRPPRKGPASWVSKFYVWHFRFRFMFYCHLPSTLYGLSTRWDLSDGWSLYSYNNSSQVCITPILQMKKNKIESWITSPWPHHLRAEGQS